MNDPARALTQRGQSIWYDNLSRDLIRDGGLAALVAQDGVAGVTTNPTIFAKAVEGSDLYDDDIRAHGDAPAEAVFFDLAVDDVGAAADVLFPVYERTGGVDGYVSLEVSPEIAYDTDTTTTAALDLFRRLDRPNVLIKIPGTAPGIPAVRSAIAAGVNVNVTLLFAVDRYREAAAAYIGGLEDVLASGGDPTRSASVASFFVSRVDSAVDARLEEIASPAALSLRGRVAVANAKLAYRAFQDVYGDDRWTRLAAAGARAQRPLWASTSTKNPAYPDLLYVDGLIGPETVNTMPPQTLAAFADHGEVDATLEKDVDEAARVMAAVADVGVDFAAVTEDLERAGVQAFVDSYHQCLDAIEAKRADL